MFAKAKLYADKVSRLDPNNYQEALYIEALAGETAAGDRGASKTRHRQRTP